MHLRHLQSEGAEAPVLPRREWGEFPECPMFCTQHRGISPGLLLLDQRRGRRAGVRLLCVIANSRGKSGGNGQQRWGR